MKKLNVKKTIILIISFSVFINPFGSYADKKPKPKPVPKKEPVVTTKFVPYPKEFKKKRKYRKAHTERYLVERNFSTNNPDAAYYAYYVRVKTKTIDIVCDLGDKYSNYELKPIVCKGKFPKSNRQILSIKIGDFPTYTKYANANTENHDQNNVILPKRYIPKLHILPKGYKIDIKFDSKFRSKAKKKKKKFKPSQSVCIRTYDNKFMCRNAYGHGFFIDDLSVYYF